MEANGLAPGNGPVVVSGATGGVGSITIDVLSRLGYHAVALTGKENEAGYLHGLGAKEVMSRKSLDLSKIKPLDKPPGPEPWTISAGSARVDGEHDDACGTIASIGPCGEHESEYLGRALHPARREPPGIDSGATPMPLRREVWRRLAGTCGRRT